MSSLPGTGCPERLLLLVVVCPNTVLLKLWKPTSEGGRTREIFYCAPNHRKFRVVIDRGTVVMPRLLFSSQDDLSGDSPASFEDKYVKRSSCAPHAIERMLLIFNCKLAFFIPPRNADFVGSLGLRDRRHSGPRACILQM